jgi:hypothetical protein
MLALLFVATMGFARKLYIMQEAIVVLLLLAVLTAAILVLSVVFILFLEGISWAVLWRKTGITHLSRLAGLSCQAPHLAKEMSHAKH